MNEDQGCEKKCDHLAITSHPITRDRRDWDRISSWCDGMRDGLSTHPAFFESNFLNWPQKSLFMVYYVYYRELKWEKILEQLNKVQS